MMTSLNTCKPSTWTEHGTKPGKTSETRVFRRLSGEWSIWNSDSNGAGLTKVADLRVRNEIAAPAEQDTDEIRGYSFQVVQEKEDTTPVKKTEPASSDGGMGNAASGTRMTGSVTEYLIDMKNIPIYIKIKDTVIEMLEIDDQAIEIWAQMGFLMKENANEIERGVVNSDGVMVEKFAVLTPRQEIAPPVEQDSNKVQGPSF